ncbi:hypothetical protein GCM10010424_53620 [Streptomyces lienomycini]
MAFTPAVAWDCADGEGAGAATAGATCIPPRETRAVTEARSTPAQAPARLLALDTHFERGM